MTSPYISNTDADRKAMLESTGAASVADLFLEIPESHRDPALDLPTPLSEFDLIGEFRSLSLENANLEDYACFLGAGSYNHYVPSVVRHLAGRSEFYTSYTPYQAEISQGTLQTTYDFQSMVCHLTGMDVANAGMYDGSTALAEAALMACRLTRRRNVLVLDSVSPLYRDTIACYMAPQHIGITVSSPDALAPNDETACIIVQYPDFYGRIESLAAYADAAHEAGALLVVSADPVALAMFRAPGDYGADIVVGEGQAVGSPTAFGGPYVGLFAAKTMHLRQMPGRIVGKTTDDRGREGYVLTLQTREQHIRRQTATSNICTSEALVALASTAYLTAVGPKGLAHVAELCYHKAHYAASRIAAIPGYSLAFDVPFFREFVVQCPRSPSEIIPALLESRIVGGLDVSDTVPNGMLLCVTEVNTRDQIDQLVQALENVAQS